MKLRLLNATHQSLSFLGILHGYYFVHEPTQDPVWQEFLMNYLENEA